MKTATLFGVLLVLASPVFEVHAEDVTEYEVKAAFLYNFAKFVEWPPNSFPTSSGPVRFCVIGNDPVSSNLQHIVAGKMIGTHPVEVQQTTMTQIRNCHVLFIGESEGPRLHEALQVARSSCALTVGDSPAFINAGGMINFTSDQNRIGFEVNLKAVQAAGLQLSSKLLSLARSVQM